ncbi:MAG: ABC transporter permease subunit [Anaerolineae bacterium]|nr:ABC transporter permease subunit [Anaerolineae bacterium]
MEAQPTQNNASGLPGGKTLAAIYGSSWFGTAFRLGALALIDAFAIWFVAQLAGEGEWILAGFVAVVTLGINAAYLLNGLYPYRWFSPGLTLLIIMIIYPTVFTVYVAFTNYKTGNNLTVQQAETQLLKQLYLPEDAPTYSWTVFRSSDDPDTYALWLIPTSDLATETLFVPEGAQFSASEVDLGEFELDDDGIPTGIPGYERLGKADIGIIAAVLPEIEFGESDNVIKIKGQRAGIFRQKYTLNDDGSLYDNETGVLYKAIEGTYTPTEGPNMTTDGVVLDADGEPLDVIRPGYYVPIGFDNFQRLIENERIRGPFIRVFLWTVAHAFFSVLLTFSLGLFLSLMLNAGFMPGRAILRTGLLVPYAIPAFISVLVWKGLLNEHLGVVNKAVEYIGLEGPRWTSNQWWVKVGILLIQLWLGFPYMMLITTGALQSLPGDIYEAAKVDGASVWQQFWNLTLPLLLVAVGPLLIASFAFNFNNFTIVELFNEGNPPISPDTAAGHSDILITYTYQLAFGSGRGADYGFASTISLVIFLMVAVITFFNFRFTQSWEEISENV